MKAKYEAPTMEIIKIETTTLLVGSGDKFENRGLKFDDIEELDITEGNL